MAYVATAPTEYLADELVKVIDLPKAYRGLKVMFVPKAPFLLLLLAIATYTQASLLLPHLFLY